MQIRKAMAEDLPIILDTYEIARRFMREHGNPYQWSDSGYPSVDLLECDIKLKQLYVLESDDGLEGVFMYNVGPDPTYHKIDGEWLNSEPYSVIHRIASRGRKKGVLRLAVDFATKFSKNIKIDTHEYNTVMQNALQGLGFKRCGTIYLENGDPRIAYQLKI
ncbi:MAG: GNAT family N-acetyltransferase [Ruminococcaceae bacterium]|nr:GNAT family N-acetyltransferase [Oscillospiraceae bacterium]